MDYFGDQVTDRPPKMDCKKHGMGSEKSAKKITALLKIEALFSDNWSQILHSAVGGYLIC